MSFKNYLNLFVKRLMPLLFFSSAVIGAESITLYTYHKTPPFITGANNGLTYDLAKYLTEKSGGAYQFDVEVMPRKRLDQLMVDTDMVIPWVTPAWFGPGAAEKYQWSKPILEDGSIYVWRPEANRTFSTPDELKGARLGGILGYRYINIDPLVASGEVSRVDTQDESQLLEMLLLDRFDVGIAPLSASRYLMKSNQWTEKLSFSLHHGFLRSFLLKTDDQQLNDFIQIHAQEMGSDSQWADILGNYGLSPKHPMSSVSDAN